MTICDNCGKPCDPGAARFKRFHGDREFATPPRDLCEPCAAMVFNTVFDAISHVIQSSCAIMGVRVIATMDPEKPKPWGG